MVAVNPASNFQLRTLAREKREKGGDLLHVHSETRPLRAGVAMRSYRSIARNAIGNGEVRIWFVEGKRYIELEELQQATSRTSAVDLQLSVQR